MAVLCLAFVYCYRNAKQNPLFLTGLQYYRLPLRMTKHSTWTVFSHRTGQYYTSAFLLEKPAMNKRMLLTSCDDVFMSNKS